MPGDTVAITIRLSCFDRRKGKLWVSGCPSLDVYSQGRTKKEARASLEEAVRLWIDSCMERNTLDQALVELGWHRLAGGVHAPSLAGDYIGVQPALEPADSVLGEAFPLEVTIPAFQAAAFLAASNSAAG